MSTYTLDNTESLANKEEIIDKILKEPFALHFSFSELTLEKIFNIIETYDDIDTQNGQLIDSFYRTKELFILLLQNLEKDNVSDCFTKKLNELKSEDQSTPSISIKECSEEDDTKDFIAIELQEEDNLSEVEVQIDEETFSEVNLRQHDNPVSQTELQLNEKSLSYTGTPSDEKHLTYTELPSNTLSRTEPPMEDLVFINKQAEEYWSLYLFLRKVQEHTEVQYKKYLDTLCAQCLCFSLEMELQDKFSSVIPLFLQYKSEVIKVLLTYDNDSVSLNGKVMQYLKENSSDFSFQIERLENALLNSFQFLNVVTNNISLSLLEIGVMVMFFGQEIKLSEKTFLHNLLNLDTRQNLCELFLMLSKFQFIKNEVCSPYSKGIDVLLLAEDFKTILKILKGIQVKKILKTAA